MKKTSKNGHSDKNYLADTTDRIGEIAIQYGFSVIKHPSITTANESKAKQFNDSEYYGDAAEKIALLEWYSNENMTAQQQPLMFFYKKPQSKDFHKNHSTKADFGSNVQKYELEIMGSQRSICEALLLKCILAMLTEFGHREMYIDINSIGDKESISRFERELTSYLKKHSSQMPAKLREETRKNHYAILSDNSPELSDVRVYTPQPVSALSEQSRIHFREVLESIEAFEIPYKIKAPVLSNKNFASLTCFEIHETENKKTVPRESLLAYGYRYNYLGKKIGLKRDVSCIGATLAINKNKIPAKKIVPAKIKKPRFYLAQLGNVAKIKALNVLEILRKNKISVNHSLIKDKIVGQLSGAEYAEATHVLIIGQKEAFENTVVVRNITTREQETVPVTELAEFLKKL